MEEDLSVVESLVKMNGTIIQLLTTAIKKGVELEMENDRLRLELAEARKRSEG